MQRSDLTPSVVGEYFRHKPTAKMFEIVGYSYGVFGDEVSGMHGGCAANTTGFPIDQCELMMLCPCGDVVELRQSGQCDTCDAIDEM